MAKVIGYLILQLKRYITENHGKEALDKILEECRPDTSEVISGVVFASQMYDLSIFQDFLDSFAEQTSKASVQDFAESIVKDQLKGLYGIVTKFLTVEKLMSRAQSMWEKQYDQGKLEVTAEDNAFVISISDFPWNENYRILLMYYFRELVEIVTGKSKVTRSYKEIAPQTTEFRLEVEE